MKRISSIILSLGLIVLINSSFAQPSDKVDFESYFVDKTMRLDYIHRGDVSSEKFELVSAKPEGVWAGKTYHLTDPYQLGLYFYEVYDAATNKLLFSQGFCSVFGEWQTTAEAKIANKPFNESIRIPWPKAKVNIVMKKRDAKNILQPIWNFEVDPAVFNAAQKPSSVKVNQLLNNGDVKSKVDIVILGDGYTADEMNVFRKDANKFVEYFFAVDPYKARKNDFNVWSVEVISAESGIANPNKNFFPKNPLETTYNTFGVDRYVLSNNDWAVRDYAGAVPYDFIVILLNSNKYGGGGIYNLYITAGARSDYNDYVFVHEMGHHIAGLADEYYQSHVAYDPVSTSVEPWEFNVTALLNPDSLKWKDLVTPGTPIPTPWSKDEFEKSNSDKSELLRNDPYAGKVGAFEGANYLSNGMYRPEVDCIMFSKSLRFCKVCERGLNRVIDLYCK
ncbi:MAG: peptidase M64 [Bacteroidales bacterium]|nr:peptidase M64 [Bacteroidales bacterium]